MGRINWKRRWICMILMVGVLLTGISYVCMEVDSVCTALDVSSGKLTSGFLSQSTFSQKEQVDSEEVSGLRFYSEGDEAQDLAQERKDAETRLLLILLLVLLPMLSCCQAEGNWHMMEVIKQKQRLLILYIHQKDGSKIR